MSRLRSSIDNTSQAETEENIRTSLNDAEGAEFVHDRAQADRTFLALVLNVIGKTKKDDERLPHIIELFANRLTEDTILKARVDQINMELTALNEAKESKNEGGSFTLTNGLQKKNFEIDTTFPVVKKLLEEYEKKMTLEKGKDGLGSRSKESPRNK